MLPSKCICCWKWGFWKTQNMEVPNRVTTKSNSARWEELQRKAPVSLQMRSRTMTSLHSLFMILPIRQRYYISLIPSPRNLHLPWIHLFHLPAAQTPSSVRCRRLDLQPDIHSDLWPCFHSRVTLSLALLTSVKMPLSICHCLAADFPIEPTEATEHSKGILIEMLPGEATGQRTVMGIMAVMIEMAW